MNKGEPIILSYVCLAEACACNFQVGLRDNQKLPCKITCPWCGQCYAVTYDLVESICKGHPQHTLTPATTGHVATNPTPGPQPVKGERTARPQPSQADGEDEEG